jgi:hypothetical protein
VELRYGINPQQRLTDVSPVEAGSWPVRLLNLDPPPKYSRVFEDDSERM